MSMRPQDHTLDYMTATISDVNGFFPVEKKNVFFFWKKTTKIKKTFFFFLVSLFGNIYILPYIYCLFFVFQSVSTLH